MNMIRMSFFTLLLTQSAFAQEISITGTTSQIIKEPVLTQALEKKQKLKVPAFKFREIKLLKVALSDKGEAILARRVETAFEESKNEAYPGGGLPSNVQLGMNGVPVLNQGSHGTCVAFANTAAIDAALNKGDYVSQLCTLQLSNYFGSKGYSGSGWDGSFGPLILNQLTQFGFVNKQKQIAHGCGGLTQYPQERSDTSTMMTLGAHYELSEALDEDQIAWSSILDPYQSLSDQYNRNKTLLEVKRSLASGDRLTFGLLLINFDLGMMGATGTKNKNYDTWILTPEVIKDMHSLGAHEMVITGYDDNAIARDDSGQEHQGLLTLRNSWGKHIGDSGDFYMSYDYFKVFILELQRIRSLKED